MASTIPVQPHMGQPVGLSLGETTTTLSTENDPKDSSATHNDDEKAVASPTFPEGCLRAWSVAAGHAGAMFCTFGYINSFGFVQQSPECRQEAVKASHGAMLM